MNMFICTAYLLSQPKLTKLKHQNLCYTLLSLNNCLDNTPNIRIKAFAKGKVAKQVFNLYRQKNCVIIESSIYVKKIRNLDKNKKKSKMIFVKIHKIHNFPI
uniref:Ycf41 n=1 Tax=Gracilaria hainanensis TaxID=2871843 RepID=A0AAU7YPU3_9FLOR